ncbi:MAG TPA: chloramphenicol acetyltransferase [Clostridia bacterium]|nr:chloramphenicol acetyltransferase [Clostridia bacterium]
MNYRYLDLERYPRRGQFEYFRNMAYPYAGMTSNLDITQFMACLKKNGWPFFLTMLYAATRAANAIPEFRRRIRQDGIVEFDRCIPSYTLAVENGSYCYCAADERLPFAQYLVDAKSRQEEAKKAPNVMDGENSEQLFFISTIPWISYTALVQPVPSPADSNPRITWGKYFESEGRLRIPVSVLVHHALMDGYPISLFFQELQSRLDDAGRLSEDAGR